MQLSIDTSSTPTRVPRVVFGRMRSTLLQDILTREIEGDPGLDLVPRSTTSSRGADTRELIDLLRDTGADVVIFDLERDELPPSCNEVLDVAPGAMLVGIAGDGRRTSLYLDDTGVDRLLAAIKATAHLGL